MEEKVKNQLRILPNTKLKKFIELYKMHEKCTTNKANKKMKIKKKKKTNNNNNPV
jgi:hypothetical protein